MAIAVRLRYSNRSVTQRSAGRYECRDLWQVSGITSVKDPDGDGTGAIARAGTDTWLHEILNATDLPDIGDVDQDGQMVCVALHPVSTPLQATADVEVTWQEDPLTLPTEVHYFSSSKIKPAWRAQRTGPITGGAAAEDPITAGAIAVDVRNAAGDRFNPPVTYEAPLERIEVTFHCSLKWHDGIIWANYLKHWNSEALDIVTTDPDNDDNSSTRSFDAIGSLFLADKRAPLVKEPYLHRLVTLTFLYDPDLWGQRVANMGPRANFTAANKPGGWSGNWPATGLCPVVDSYGNPFGGLAELDADGKQMFPTTLTDPTTMPDALVYQWWPVEDGDVSFGADFSDLELFLPERAADV